jgi:hypothetical protein
VANAQEFPACLTLLTLAVTVPKDALHTWPESPLEKLIRWLERAGLEGMYYALDRNVDGPTN